MAKAGWYERKGEKTIHVAYLDKKANEFEKLLNGEKTMLIRGANGRKLPYGRVFENEEIYFICNDGSGKIIAKGVTGKITESGKMEDENQIKEFIEKFKNGLNLSDLQYKRWREKKYLVIIEIKNFEKINPMNLDHKNNMDDWILVSDINDIIMKQQ